MSAIVLVEKTGTLKQSSCSDIQSLYKSCGFRKPDGFELCHTWNNLAVATKVFNISVYARSEGKANTENKYDMPPPIDTDLYFGTCAIVNTNKAGELIDLSVADWNKVYEFLFGGFENLDDFEDDDNEEDELEAIPANMKTKIGGYLKDGFVVDNSGDEEDCDEDGNCSDEDDISIDNKKRAKVEDSSDDDEEELGCGSELECEEYEYSDEN